MTPSASAWLTALFALAYLTFLELIFPRMFLYDDSLTQFLPWYEFNYQAFRHGVIPQINFYQFLGQTYLSNAQNGFFYPPILIATALGHFTRMPSLSIEWLAWIHLSGAALVVERLARTLGAVAPASILAGLIYLTCPVIIGMTQLWILVSFVIFFVPLSFLQMERCLAQPTSRRVWQYGLIKALFLLSGHVNYFAFALIFEAIYLLLRVGSLRRVIAPLGVWLTANGLGLLWALPSIGPVLAHLQSEDRSKPLTFAQVTLGASIDAPTFLAAQFGYFLNHTYFYQAAWDFLGGSVLIVPILVWCARTHPRLRVLLIVGATAILLSSPLFWMIHYLPFYQSFRWPGKNLLFVAFFYALAVGSLPQVLSPHRIRFAHQLCLISLLLNILIFLCPVTRTGSESYARYWTGHLPLEQMRDGRNQVLTLGLAHAYDPDLLTFDFATQSQVYAFHGYDPLTDKNNFEQALRTEFIGLLWHPLDDATVAHLRYWSVRYYLLDLIAPMPPVLASTKSWINRGVYGLVDLYEDPEAAPLAYFEDRPTVAVPLTFGYNVARIETGNQHGILSVSLLNLPGYHARAGATWFQPLPEIAPGRIRLEIKENGPVYLSYAEPHLTGFICISLGSLLLSFLAVQTAPRRLIFAPI